MAIQFNMDAALAKLGELVAAHGAQAIETAAQVERINAINSLSGIVGWGALAAMAAWTARWSLRRAKSENEEMWIAGTVIAWVAAGALMIPALCSLFDVWAWVALFNPKLALAHHILDRLTGS